MSKFFQELKRRHVFKASLSYIVVAWAILQVAAIVFPIFNLEQGAMRFLLIALIVCFPIWVILAYVFEITPTGLKKTTESTGQATHKSTSKRLNQVIIGGLSLAVVLLITDRVFNLTSDPSSTNSEKSIAVLPFVNLSNDPEQEYFSDGLTDDILTQLAKIKQFRVISRTSVMQFKDNPLPIKQVAEQLNVGLILEGSVQKSGNQLRITAQLIDATTDQHLWAESYDRSVEELFSIQREVATAIAHVLEAQLSPEESQKLNTTPTENIHAYQLFQQGRYYLNQPHFDFDAWQKAIISLEEAVLADPQFAEAYAMLAKAHSRIYYLRRDHTPDRLQNAEKANAQALSLDAGNPEVQLAAGYFQLWVKKDRVAALSFFEQASKGLPNSVEVLKAKAWIYEPQGKFDLYIQTMEKAVDVSPLDNSCWTMLAFGYEFTYQFDKGLKAVAKSTALDPEASWNHLAKGFINISYKGADDESRAAFQHVKKTHSWYLWAMFHQEMFEDRFDAALELIEEYPKGVDSKMARIPQPLLRAYIYAHQDKKELAKQNFELSLTELKLAIDSMPDDDRTHSALGLSYAGLGIREEAIFHGKKAKELMPYNEEAIYGQPAILDMALIYTMLGEYDLAFEHLETILAGPSYWSTKWLENDVRYHKLKEDPRFNDLVSTYQKSYR